MALDRKYLAKWANREFDLLSLLSQVGVYEPRVGALVYCPFHPDKEGGKRSAKIFADALHCFSCVKQYRPYNILRFMGYTDYQIEQSLRAKGAPPEDLYINENVRIDICTPILSTKARYMQGEISFGDYTEFVLKSISQTIETKYNGNR